MKESLAHRFTGLISTAGPVHSGGKVEHHAVHVVDMAGAPDDRSKRPEWIAERVLPMWTDTTVTKTDVSGGPPGMYDLELRFTNGRTAAVEVRTCIDPVAASFGAALRNHGVMEPVPQLAKLWHVRPEESTRLDGLADLLVPYLVAMEAAGIDAAERLPEHHPDGQRDYFWKAGMRSHQTGAPPQAVIYLEGLGIRSAWSYQRQTDLRGAIVFDRPYGGGSNRTEHLVTASVDQAAREKARVLSSNRALACDERHLFVWLDSDYCGEAEFALYSGYPGDAPAPELPACITTVWVGGWSWDHGIGHVLAWRANRGEGWTRVDLPGL